MLLTTRSTDHNLVGEVERGMGQVVFTPPQTVGLYVGKFDFVSLTRFSGIQTSAKSNATPICENVAIVKFLSPSALSPTEYVDLRTIRN